MRQTPSRSRFSLATLRARSACSDHRRCNKQVKASGHDEQAISYTDYMGIIMGSVTDIVNTISLVLIAFVSINLW